MRDEVAFEGELFEGFEEGVLGGDFHEVGFVDDEEFAAAAEGAFVDFGFLVFLGVAGDFLPRMTLMEMVVPLLVPLLSW